MLLLFNLLYVIIDLTIVSSMGSMGNKTSTYLMYHSSHDKKIIALLNFAFK